MTIENVMSKDIIYVNINSNIYEVANKMKTYDVGMVLINDSSNIIGIITDRDIVVNNIYNKTENIKDFISRNIINISKDEDLETATQLMKDKKIKRLIVTDNNKIVGVLSLSDIVNNISSDLFTNTFKSIYEINRNNDQFNTDIDEFYL